MADFRAIEAVSESIIHLLRLSYVAADFDGMNADFQVFDTQDFETAMNFGVSLYLYRVLVNDSHRIPSGRVLPNGDRFQTRLPVDLHYLAVIWAQDASTQHRLAGWVLRTLEDTPIIPRGLIDSVMPGVFEADESIELFLDRITTEDLMRIWDAVRERDYQLSIPYIARNICIESRNTITSGAEVQERHFDMGTLQSEE